MLTNSHLFLAKDKTADYRRTAQRQRDLKAVQGKPVQHRLYLRHLWRLVNTRLGKKPLRV